MMRMPRNGGGDNNFMLAWRRFVNRIRRTITIVCTRLLRILTIIFRIITAALCLARDNPYLAGVKTYKSLRLTTSFLVRLETNLCENAFQLLGGFVQRLVHRREERSLIKAVFLLLLLNGVSGALYLFDLRPLMAVYTSNIRFLIGQLQYVHPAHEELKNVIVNVVYRDHFCVFGTMLLKTYVIVVPAAMVDYSMKESLYQLVEYTSQLCRILLPIQPWLIFWTDGFTIKSLPAQISTLLLIAFYLHFKFTLEIRRSLRKWWRALVTCDNIAGINIFAKAMVKVQVTSSRESTIDDECTICCEIFINPKVLACKHTYCKNCIDTWFRQLRMMKVQTTCPLCRAKVVEDNDFKDGSTVDWKVVF